MSRTTVTLFNVTIDSITEREALQRARRFLQEPKFHHIVTPGPEFLLEASEHPAFFNILNRADLSLPDGMGLRIGATLTGQRLKQRIPGADFVDALMAMAEREGSRVFLYGGGHGVAERAAHTLLRRHPKLNIVGIESGTRGHWSAVQDQRIVERIHLVKPDILLVALGAPKQEHWIDRHRAALHHVRIAMGVGRTFDYLAGTIPRAPKLMRTTGFEWLHTYLNAGRYYQPRHRRQRITNATIRFMVELMKHRREKN